ncbi:hypothetical protein [Aquamicrobium sp. LC103]|uniref:hypothetical protein n=1 Tax=Aquamicrobium sp. LC103 TaxID=1120658 RepID=UPI00063E8AD7|nr:hypothetical protein [Aquamicrobium sp. LC103]TKT78397.1 hypothetical protein XW59_012335 [Aquamicrobium sp. LC103]
MAAVLQKKGPAEAATSPDRGSNILAKEFVNVATNSTDAAHRQARHENIVSGMYDIEGDVYDLVNMVRIAADLVSSELRPCGPDDSCVTIKIGPQHWDMVNFAVNDCVVRANAFRKKFVDAINGEVSA